MNTEHDLHLDVSVKGSSRSGEENGGLPPAFVSVRFAFPVSVFTAASWSLGQLCTASEQNR